MPQIRVKTLAWAVGVVSSLAAVTAFGVAPLTAPDLPEGRLTIEAATLSAEVIGGESQLTQQERIRRGETLASLMSRLGADDPEFAAFVRVDLFARQLLELRAGRSVSAVLGADRTIERLSYRVGAEDPVGLGRRLVIARQSGKLVAFDEPVPAERSIETRTAVVERSLVEALDAAEIPDNVLSRMADVFGREVNLRDVRRGDRLRVVYETLHEAGSLEPPIVGRILAVQFRSGQRKLEAVWYQQANGSGDYYSFDGRSLSQPFLTSPLEFTRISSGFTESRQHPIFGDWRAHKGVDFQAPLGTKVRSTADGIVDFVGQQQVGKNRPQHGAEFTGFLVVHARAHQIGRQQVGRELDSFEAAAHGLRQRVHREGFGQSGDALDEQVALRQDGHQNAFQKSILADHHAFDFIQHTLHQSRVDA